MVEGEKTPINSANTGPFGKDQSLRPSGAQNTTVQNSQKTSGAEPISGNKTLPLKFFKSPVFILVIVVLIILVGLLTFVAKKVKVPTKNAQNSVAVSSPIGDTPPVKLPAVKNEEEKNVLSEYFRSVSSIFKDEFMAKVPEPASEAYRKYKESQNDQEKLEAARRFYIYLDNPSVASDNAYREFLEDVKDDLEDTLGKRLFE